ncbi:uncharacterized protein LOC103315915 [Nasonia vitripennis]|uniref:MADF domain-containing protein n=1 Tax=Nasonia vitripennis TaxID=7425 RepID=A0A7M7H446_NASVI|nr:uncharacterized protein LOC103315915 [Nasonia vitripennis]
MSRCEVTTPPLRNDDEWTECQIGELVRLYKQQPCLWKKDDPAYLDYRERRLAYEAIRYGVNRSNVGLIEVILKVRQVRRAYVEEWRKMVEAMSNRSRYEPELRWFDDLFFLYDYLHVDEIESIEEVAKGSFSSYSSNYCEDSPSSALTSTSKASCCLSERWPNHIKADDDAMEIFERRKNSCQRCHSTRFAGGASGSLKIAPRRRTKSDPVVYENESIQRVEPRDEGSMSSTRSRLTMRKSCDQYDLFAKRIACRLKQMNPEEASKAQREIETLLMNAELNLDIYTSASSTASTLLDNRVDPTNSQTFSILPHSKSRICVSLASSLRTEGKV